MFFISYPASLSFVETEAADLFGITNFQVSLLLFCDKADAVLLLRVAQWYNLEPDRRKGGSRLICPISRQGVIWMRYVHYLRLSVMPTLIGISLAGSKLFYISRYSIKDFHYNSVFVNRIIILQLSSSEKSKKFKIKALSCQMRGVGRIRNFSPKEYENIKANAEWSARKMRSEKKLTRRKKVSTERSLRPLGRWRPDYKT